ncbi:hypothetical protein ABK040_004655 [Willaertia magna]
MLSYLNCIKDIENNDVLQKQHPILTLLATAFSNMEGGIWVITWFILNTGLAFTNKFVFWGGFSFPILLSLSHMFFAWILSKIFIKRMQIETEISPEVKSNMWWYTVIFVLNIAFGNLSVFGSSLHLSQIVRSIIPIFVMGLSFIILKQIPSPQTIYIVVFVLVGVLMTIWENMEIQYTELIILFIGNILAALKTVLTDKSLKEHKIHPIALLHFISPFACIGMFMISLVTGELYKFYNNFHKIELFRGWGLVILTSIAAFFLNITNFIANKKTSGLTMSLTANLKQVLIVAVSMIFMREGHIYLLNVSGIIITVIGMFIYSMSKVLKGNDKKINIVIQEINENMKVTGLKYVLRKLKLNTLKMEKDLSNNYNRMYITIGDNNNQEHHYIYGILSITEYLDNISNESKLIPKDNILISSQIRNLSNLLCVENNDLPIPLSEFTLKRLSNAEKLINELYSDLPNEQPYTYCIPKYGQLSMADICLVSLIQTIEESVPIEKQYPTLYKVYSYLKTVDAFESDEATTM